MVRPLMLGGNVFGWTVDEAAAFKILDAFVDAGFDFIDTADVYSRFAPGNQGGESETILGKWFKQRGNRGKIILATKVGMEMGPGKKGLSRQYIIQALEDSLRRLQTDYVDLYQAHRDDPETGLDETMEAFARLVSAGKVRVIGASNYSAERLEKSIEISEQHGYPRYQSLQPLYNLYDRAEYEEKLEPVCRKYNLGVIPYFSLGAGFLTGKYRSEADVKGARARIVGKYVNERGLRIVQALEEVAQAKNVQAATIAVAWLIARSSITAPIASATSLEQLQNLTKAVDLELDPASLEKLNTASAW
jgi:aryl-alcohol dehydrogenase-like predicted oxidoreductase